MVLMLSSKIVSRLCLSLWKMASARLEISLMYLRFSVYGVQESILRPGVGSLEWMVMRDSDSERFNQILPDFDELAEEGSNFLTKLILGLGKFFSTNFLEQAGSHQEWKIRRVGSTTKIVDLASHIHRVGVMKKVGVQVSTTPKGETCFIRLGWVLVGF